MRPAPVRLLVIDNGGGGIFEFLPQAEQIDREEFEAILGTPVGVEAANVAGLHGIDYESLANLGDLAGLASRTVLAEIRTDRAENVALHRRLREAAEKAVTEALG